jgi:ChAPs (Chs5p-Arf1p-binding proteins)
MRVEVKIPGGVKTHVIDERGNKLTPSHEELMVDKRPLRHCGWKRMCPV